MRRIALVFALFLVAALPLTASQFVPVQFDDVARGSEMVVRGTVGPVISLWDEQDQVIYSYAEVRVSRYFAGEGPEYVMVREVGGTVGDYTQLAVGFPELREGEEIVLFLSRWEDGRDWRIEAYNEGKYLVRRGADGRESLVHDPVTQGADRFSDRERIKEDSLNLPSLTMDEFISMVGSARAAREHVREQN